MKAITITMEVINYFIDFQISRFGLENLLETVLLDFSSPGSIDFDVCEFLAYFDEQRIVDSQPVTAGFTLLFVFGMENCCLLANVIHAIK